MNLRYAPAQITASVDPSNTPDIGIPGRWLILVRAVWAILVIMSLGIFTVALPARFEQLQQVALQGERALQQSSHVGEFMLLKAVLSVNFYPIAILVLEIALMFGLTLAAIAIFLRKSSGRMAVFASMTLVTFGAMMSPALDALVAAHPLWRFPVSLLQAIGLECALLLYYLSPDARFIPRWTRLLAIVWTVWQIVSLMFPDAPFNILNSRAHVRLPSSWPIFWFLVVTCWFSSGMFAQVYRYRRVSSLVERQQTKWVIIGVTPALVGYIAFELPRLTLPALSQPGVPNLLYSMIGVPLYLACALVIPLCIVFSILRYHLWDVDVIINRAMVYSTLTATLALLYVASIIVLQYLLRGLTGGNQLAVAGSTLAITALFQPLSHRIQKVIDRRFYRRKYNAAQIIAAFSTRLQQRDDVDLTTLTNDLLAVVEETMQPAHLYLWLRPPDQNAIHNDRTWVKPASLRNSSLVTDQQPGHDLWNRSLADESGLP
ncbi:MAG: hypothetical protein NVS3B14_12140 [Ktedonobacteraceae bacterium]